MLKQILDFLASNHDLVGAITGIFALFVSAYSIILSVRNMKAQRIHDRKSVMPIADIGVGDYESRLSVRLHNRGIGPMLIDRFLVSECGSIEEPKSSVIDCMPDLPSGILWRNFVKKIEGSALSPDKEMTLLLLEGDADHSQFVKARDTVRRALSNLRIEVTYRNIYDEQMPPAVKVLDWFGREH
jgi:hypothetical protein